MLKLVKFPTPPGSDSVELGGYGIVPVCDADKIVSILGRPAREFTHGRSAHPKQLG